MDSSLIELRPTTSFQPFAAGSFYDRVVNERGLRRTLDVEEAVGYEAGVTAFSLIMPSGFQPPSRNPAMQQAFDSAKDAEMSHDQKDDKRLYSGKEDVESFEHSGGPFVTVAERTRMPIVFSDPNLPGNPIVFANDSFLALCGYERDEVLGQNYHFLMGPDSDPAARAQIDAAFSEGYGATFPEVCYYRKDGGTFWAIIFVGPVLNSDGQVAQHFASFLDITRRKQDEKRAKLLLAELDHRVKNTLATVQAIARQSLRGTAIGEQVQRSFEGRILALANAHSLLARESWEGARLGEVIEQVLQPFGLKDRFSIHGDDVYLEAGTALALAMTFHELATNAVKHGALSDDAGHVDITWQNLASQSCERIWLRWQERDGPPVAPPSRKGTGLRLVERGLAHALNSEVHLHFELNGLICELLMPVSSAAEGRAS